MSSVNYYQSYVLTLQSCKKLNRKKRNIKINLIKYTHIHTWQSKENNAKKERKDMYLIIIINLLNT